MNFVVDWPPYFRLSLEQKICVNVCSERNVTTFLFVHNQIKSEVKKIMEISLFCLIIHFFIRRFFCIFVFIFGWTSVINYLVCMERCAAVVNCEYAVCVHVCAWHGSVRTRHAKKSERKHLKRIRTLKT